MLEPADLLGRDSRPHASAFWKGQLRVGNALVCLGETETFPLCRSAFDTCYVEGLKRGHTIGPASRHRRKLFSGLCWVSKEHFVCLLLKLRMSKAKQRHTSVCRYDVSYWITLSLALQPFCLQSTAVLFGKHLLHILSQQNSQASQYLDIS